MLTVPLQALNHVQSALFDARNCPGRATSSPDPPQLAPLAHCTCSTVYLPRHHAWVRCTSLRYACENRYLVQICTAGWRYSSSKAVQPPALNYRCDAGVHIRFCLYLLARVSRSMHVHCMAFIMSWFSCNPSRSLPMFRITYP